MDGGGVRLGGNALAPSREATAVQVRCGEVVVGDWPAADAAQQAIGSDLLECADLNEAVDVAAMHPLARSGTAELGAFEDT